jgi:hypothetical protein
VGIQIIFQNCKSLTYVAETTTALTNSATVRGGRCERGVQALGRRPSKPAKGVAALVLPPVVSQALQELAATIDAALVPLEAALERWLGASDDSLVAVASACLTAAPPFAAVTQV